MNELHLTKRDFELQWFSGQGAGGQHRNKHQNCCRIRHKESGMQATGTASRSRQANLDNAFRVLAARLIQTYCSAEQDRISGLGASGGIVRHYSACRNEVRDSTGMRARYDDVVRKGDIGPMIEARLVALAGEDNAAHDA